MTALAPLTERRAWKDLAAHYQDIRALHLRDLNAEETLFIFRDVIAFAQPLNPLGRHHDLLLANLFAQAEALAFGKTPQAVKAENTSAWLMPHKTFEGSRPSNTILMERLTPRH